MGHVRYCSTHAVKKSHQFWAYSFITQLPFEVIDDAKLQPPSKLCLTLESVGPISAFRTEHPKCRKAERVELGG